jgi:NAD+ synthetase
MTQIGGGFSSNSRSIITVGAATVNQFILDFENNRNNIIQAITEAKSKNVKVLGFPELAICGYSCQDHYYERELFVMSYYMLQNIVTATKEDTKNMIVALGCPIMHRDVRYNCTVFFGYGKIFLIRPKIILADDGNYREARWFTPWLRDGLEDFYFDDNLGMHYDKENDAIPFGVGVINCNGILIGAEICEELWVSDNIGAKFFLSGVDILINGSGSHYEKGKQEEKREVLIKATTRKSGGVYIYSNLEGCDGERLYFDGGSIIAMNGKIESVADRYLLKDVQVTLCNINLDDIVTYRLRSNSHQTQASRQIHFPEIKVDLDLTEKNNTDAKSYNYGPKQELNVDFSNNPLKKHIRHKYRTDPKFEPKKVDEELSDSMHTILKTLESAHNLSLPTNQEATGLMMDEKPTEDKVKELEKYQIEFLYRKRMQTEIPSKAIHEICNTAACWLFDYLERSTANGFLLPLSGGADSAATASIVYRMCELMLNHLRVCADTNSRVYKFLELKHRLNIADLLRMTEAEAARMICNKVLYTVYLPTKFSGETANLAKAFADEIGSNHHVISIQDIVEASMGEITKIPFDVITNEVTYKREILQKNQFMKDNIEQIETRGYGEQLSKFNQSLSANKQKFLENYSEVVTHLQYQSLSNNLYHVPIGYDTPTALESNLSPTAHSIFSAHSLKLRNMREQAARARVPTPIPDWQISELEENFKNDFEKLNEIHTMYSGDGTKIEYKSKWDIPMQNIQARIRMVMAYLIGQMSVNSGYLLNLGSSNSDEVYVGYYTKYDASSADINPIGSLPKIYIQRILIVFGNTLSTLHNIINQEPTAELLPGLIGGNQTDEDDIGLKYMEMSELSRLMSSGYGPLDSYMKISTEPNDVFKQHDSPYKLKKIQTFNFRYRMNRHKAVILPPSVHLLSYSPDDNRYNLRPFLYPNFASSLENEILIGMNI